MSSVPIFSIITISYRVGFARVCVCVCVFIKLHITTQSGPVILVILCVCVRVCVCVFIKLHITAQSGLVILVILCHSRRSSQGGINDTCYACVCVCVCVYLLNCT